MWLKSFVYLFVLVSPILAYKSYDGYKVYRTTTLDEISLPKLSSVLSRYGSAVDAWSSPRVGEPADLMVAPEIAKNFWEDLVQQGFKPQILVDDVETLVKLERLQIEKQRATEKLKNSRAPTFDRYMDFYEILAYLDEVAMMYPEIATLITIGQTYYGLPIQVIKLSNGPGKTAIFFDAAIHAREWAAPTVAMYAINELTANLVANKAMLDKNDFYFAPLINGDGYVYTWEVDRFWRKNRSPNNGSICLGTDLNRNFDYNWAGGGMTIKCDLFYHGSAAFSETESTALSNFILSTPEITFYTAIHSYGQYILYPYGDKYELPPTYDELDRVAREAATAIQAVNGTRYRVGTSAALLYFAYGQSDDWAYDVAGIPFSYTIELPGGGTGGFDLPPENIRPMAAETFEAIRVFAVNIPDVPRK